MDNTAHHLRAHIVIPSYPALLLSPLMSDANLAALYQEMILDHYRRPRNKGTLDQPDESIDMKNPLCGDEIGLHIAFDGTTISDIKFTGRGCSISQASASMMTELVKGKETAAAEEIRETFRAMVMGDNTAAQNPMLGKARALSGVSKYPARVKCALLGWNALETGMQHHAEMGENTHPEPQNHSQAEHPHIAHTHDTNVDNVNSTTPDGNSTHAHTLQEPSD